MNKVPVNLPCLGLQSPLGGGVAAAILMLVAGCSPPQWASKREAEAPAEAATVQPASGKTPEGVPAPHRAANLYGKTATETFPGKGACVGNLDGVLPARDGFGRSVFGWAWDSAAKTSVSRLVLGNSLWVRSSPLATVVVFGRMSLELALTSRTQKMGWVVRIGDLVDLFDAYCVLSDGTSLCRLGHLQK